MCVWRTNNIIIVFYERTEMDLKRSENQSVLLSIAFFLGVLT